jgi:amino acid transporter
VLTILGVIMYLRLGWVVGNAGLVGAVAIILLAKSVTICTGLSMSSITTNIKIGAGGAYSIISKSLGLEAGGSIGIPLYIAQTLSAALYIIGFTEAWIGVFPTHSPVTVSIVAWAGLLVVTSVSADLAIRTQYLIMAIVGLSIVSFGLTPAEPLPEPVLLGHFEDAGFWQVFAIFFPAVTGIMAGANMSGDLKNPRRAIPRGTISAILVTMVIYIGLAYLAARVGSPEELRTNQLFMVDKALWGPAVLAGIMGATLSSALGSMLGAPRMLQAMAEQRIVPFHQTLSFKSRSNEPRYAAYFTGGAILAALVMGNLDVLASLITMFFLITYGTLNLVVFLQQNMKIISFRPTFKIPPFVPLLGAVGCIFMMFLINPIFSIVALVTIVVFYIWLTRRGLEAPEGDIRGGLFLALAERASRLADKFPRHQVTWKPDFLVPIEDPEVWAGPLLFIRNATYPSGSIFAFTITTQEQTDQKEQALNELLLPLKGQEILVNSAVIEDDNFLHGAKSVIQTLRGGAFRPNTLFLTIGDDNQLSPNSAPASGQPGRKRAKEQPDSISQLVALTLKHQMGVAILRQHSRMAFGMQQDVNLWLRDKSPNWHLAMLMALQLQLNWDGKINLVTVTPDEADKERLHNFLEHLGDQARLPSLTEFHVLIGDFKEVLSTAPRADINIFGLSVDENVPLDFIKEVSEAVKSSCVFVIDSGYESALA